MSDFSNYKVLIVDDEPDIIELLEYNIKKEGFQTKTANDGEQAVAAAKEFKPDIILMDVMMPKMDGIEACRIIKESSKDVDPYVIFLTARAEEYTEVAAFDVGANDFLAKPIKPRALVSRIQSVIKRIKKDKNQDSLIEIADIKIDKLSYTVFKDDVQLTLPKKEFEILFFLASNPDKVYDREKILSKVWGSDVYVVSRTVDVHVRKLREKIGEGYIHTIKGVGYKFSPDGI